jgi:pimeloyl-ACP methyl ester carboxylesterase
VAAAPRPIPAPRGVLIDIGGRRLHLVRAGPPGARPCVLLEAGSFGFSVDWAVVQARLAARGIASLAYDRAGLGHSDPGPAPRDATAIADDLEALLAVVGESGPFVHVGHSMAGLHAHLFAGRNPEKLMGLVLVDAVTPTSAEGEFAMRVAAHYVRFSQAAAWAAGRGLLRPLSRVGDTIGLPAEPAAQKRWAFAHAGHNRAAADEVVQWEASAAQARAIGPLDPAWPVAVVTAGPPLGGPRLAMTLPAQASRAGHIAHVGQANHASLLGHKHADAIVEAVEHVVRAASRT